MPEKKKKALSEMAKKNHVPNKCRKCHVMFKSKEDMELGKRHGKVRNEPIGCDVPNCTYWFHARSSKLKFKKGEDLKKVPFKCPKHTD